MISVPIAVPAGRRPRARPTLFRGGLGPGLRIAGATIIFACLPALSGADNLAENQARFGRISGDVGLLSQGADQWIEAQEGLPIEPGDHIRTGDDGAAEIVLSQNVLWLMEPQTDLETEHMESNEGRFNLSDGDLLGQVDSAHAQAPQDWEFNTLTALCAIRGTEFVLHASAKDGTRLGVLEGEVDMSPPEGIRGLETPVRIAAGHEGASERDRPPKVFDRFSPAVRALSARMADLRARLARVQNTWSPFTPEVRQDLRRRFVPPPSKRPRRVVVPRRRRPAPSGGQP